jgi:hypothetical protein
MAVISAFAALSGTFAEKSLPEEIGVFVGTAFGPLETNFALLGSLIDDGEGQISPTLFSHSVYNAAAGYVARLLEIRGPAMTFTNYRWPFLIALEEARMAVACGRISRAVVIGVETYSELLVDAYRRFVKVDSVPWEKMAVAWVLAAAGEAHGLCGLQGIKICEFSAEPSVLLTRQDEVLTVSGGARTLSPHPLAYVEALSEAVMGFDNLPGRPECWSLNSPFGSAEIEICGPG